MEGMAGECEKVTQKFGHAKMRDVCCGTEKQGDGPQGSVDPLATGIHEEKRGRDDAVQRGDEVGCRASVLVIRQSSGGAVKAVTTSTPSKSARERQERYPKCSRRPCKEKNRRDAVMRQLRACG